MVIRVCCILSLIALAVLPVAAQGELQKEELVIRVKPAELVLAVGAKAKLTAQQQRFHALWNGGPLHVIWNEEQVEAILLELERGAG